MAAHESNLDRRIAALSPAGQRLLAQRLNEMRDDSKAQQLLAYVVSHEGMDPQPSELREFLASSLPEHMVPAVISFLDDFPRTPSGKIDRAALPAPELEAVRPNSEIVSPRNEVEETLARIWREVLNLDEVRIDDSFFEVGGDSLLSIRILGKAAREGLQISAEAFIEHPTIAGFAEHVLAADMTTPSQAPISGPVPLTPIQHWFFEAIDIDHHHWNQSVVVDLSQHLTHAHVQEGLAQILRHHDALRFQFTKRESTWHQICPAETRAYLESVDLSDLRETELDDAIEQIENSLHAGMRLDTGPLLRGALVYMPDGRFPRLILVIHHLVVDEISWRIILEDLETACRQYMSAQPVQLPSKTTSFSSWSERLIQLAQSQDVLKHQDIWRQQQPQTGDAEIPIERAAVPNAQLQNTVQSANVISTSLDIEDTRNLLERLAQDFRAQPAEALLAALGCVLAEWSGLQQLVIAVEGHGREALFEGVNTARTVGWFTTVFPVLLAVPDASNIGGALDGVKQRFRSIPNNGLTHGVLRYLAKDPTVASELRNATRPRICFNYLGRSDSGADKETLFRRVDRPSGKARSERAQRAFVVEVNARISDGSLRADWTYSRNLHRHETIEHLASAFRSILQQLICGRTGSDATSVSPADFPLADIDEQELSALAQWLETDEAPDES